MEKKDEGENEVEKEEKEDVVVDVHSSLKTGSALGPIAASVLSIVMNRRKSPLISSS